jgi:endonuclease/exonuclease/phosphatase family metal-dependent hydrolase
MMQLRLDWEGLIGLAISDVRYRMSAMRTSGTITVATLNIAHGRGARGHQLFLSDEAVRRNLLKIAQCLREQNADVIALQEVDTASVWNGNFNHAELLAEQLQMPHVAVGEHMRRFNLRYGTALLSNMELCAVESAVLPTMVTLPPKGFLFSEIEVAGRLVGVVSLHLDFSRHKSRMRQVEILIERFADYSNPLIFMGDFNAEWSDRRSAVRDLASELCLQTHAENGKGLVSFPGASRCWDWILASRHFSLGKYTVLEDSVSDHRAIVATMQFLEDGNDY